MEKELAYVLLGGGLGSLCRYAIALITPDYYKGHFPLATFTANILGCLAIGILTALLVPNSMLDLLLVTGFCGGFTTFSSFSKETFLLFHNKNSKHAILYITSSAVFGLLAVFTGYVVAGGKWQ